MFALMLIYNIANSGCLLYPVQITCPDNLIWGYGKEKIIDYERNFSNPYNAASRGYIDEVILPSNTRLKIANGFKLLRKKKLENPWKKHDNIPL